MQKNTMNFKENYKIKAKKKENNINNIWLLFKFYLINQIISTK